jgi:prophage tail gpP-like protein
MAPKTVLKVNGQVYTGWKSARVMRGIESISGSFDLTVSDRGAVKGEPWPIMEEDLCDLYLGDDELVISGYVDKVGHAYSATEHTITLRGRDKTAALVDSSAYLGKWEFHGVSLLTLAKRLIADFALTVTIQPGLTLKTIEKLTIEPGDSAFEVLDKACKQVGVLPVSDGNGNLLLTRAGSRRADTELVQGENILSASSDFDGTNVFRRYVVLGQRPGTDEDYGLGASSVKGTAEDAGVRRSERVKVIRADSSVTSSQAKDRAQWEAKVRAGRAATASITVQGWQQASGALWPVNALVRVRSPLVRLDGDMLITQATYEVSPDGGTVTHLNLKRPDAFKPEPIVKAASEGAWRELRGGV